MVGDLGMKRSSMSKHWFFCPSDALSKALVVLKEKERQFWPLLGGKNELELSPGNITHFPNRLNDLVSANLVATRFSRNLTLVNDKKMTIKR